MWVARVKLREVINEKSHRNSTDDIFPKKKRTFLNVKGGVPPTLNMDENLRTKNRQHGNFCPKKLFITELNIIFPQSIISTRSASVKISLMAVLIDFGKDFLQIKKIDRPVSLFQENTLVLFEKSD